MKLIEKDLHTRCDSLNTYKLKMARKLVEKDHVEFGEDFVALTVMCYLKENMQKFLITPSKQS